MPEAEKDRLARQTGKGGMSAIAIQLANLSIQVVNLAIYSRLLPPSDFGIIALSTSFSALILIFKDLGCSAAVIQREDLKEATRRTAFTLNMGVSLALMAVSIVLAPIAARVLGEPRLTPVIIVSALFIPVTAAGAIHSALLRREMAIATDRMIALVSIVVGSVIGIVLAIATNIGYWALVAQTATAGFTQTLLLWRASEWQPRMTRKLEDAGSILGYGLPLTGTELIFFLNRRLDDLLIGWRWGTTDLGFYSRAYSILMLPQSLISGPVTGAIVPALSRLQSDPAAWRDLLLSSVRFVSWMHFAIAALIIANAQQIVALLLGPEWGRSVHILQTLGLSMFARGIMNQNPWIYLSLAQTQRMLNWQILSLPIFLIGMISGLQYGPEGVALGFGAAHLLIAFPSVYFAAAKSPVVGTGVLATLAPSAIVGAIAVAVSLAISTSREQNDLTFVSLALHLSVTMAVMTAGFLVVLVASPRLRQSISQILTIFRTEQSLR
ncbi:lipopolysaccharide biosynthesis protein [Croceicoccus sediminis]|uniref:lipopolysaccharide biosynthesis protein n=1 Tax=Croceicoccus sediminis TaxID=2571150 RepID=UPI001478A4EC|nr:lipopolysaccharide biosynthesis protein [Croceicoccus sediminis]